MVGQITFFAMPRSFFCIRPQIAWLGFYGYLFVTTTLCRGVNRKIVIRTHVSRVAPDWDLSDALSTDLSAAACSDYLASQFFGKLQTSLIVTV